MAKQKKRADGRYCKNVTIGRNENGSLKRKMVYANTQRELDLKVADLMLQVDKGAVIDDKSMTVYEWAVEWCKTYKGSMEENTLLSYEYTISKYIKHNFENTRLKDLKQIKIQNVLNEIEKENNLATANKFVSTMKQMLEKAVENDYISKNVAKGLNAKPYKPDEKEPLTNEQIAIINNTPGKIQDICLFLIYSGLRIGELIQLTWSDVDMKNRVIFITEEDDNNVKTQYSIRKVPIVQPLFELLEELDNKKIQNIDKTKDYVFKDGNDKYKRFTLNNTRYTYCRKCGFEFTYHQLRHTCTSLLYYAGVGIKEAQDWMGHASAKTTMDIYTHLQDKDKKAATQKIDEYLKTV